MNVFRKIESYLREKLYCQATGLFYDRIRNDQNDPFGDLPYPAEIAIQFPNPGGFGTGMEDCAINAGHMLEYLAFDHILHNADICEKSENILRGLRLCESVHGKNGFLVRGVSHRDGKSCYFNSSRDQLTMAVAGMFDLYRLIPSLPAAQKDLIRIMLSEIAAYCQKTVTAENDWSYLRLDGGRALVSTLWNCATHEMLRLPMIYTAAFETGREPQFLQEAMKYMEEGLRASEQFDEKQYYWDFPIIQMQISLDVLRHSPSMKQYHNSLAALMNRVAKAAYREFMIVLERCEKFDGDWYSYNTNWRLLPMRIMRDSLKNNKYNAVVDGFTYLNPVYDENFYNIVELQRSLGNYLTTALLAPENPVAPRDFERFLAFADSVDYTRTTHAGPFSLLHGGSLGEFRFAGMLRDEK